MCFQVQDKGSNEEINFDKATLIKSLPFASIRILENINQAQKNPTF